jgi:hypothetical protein
MKKALTIGAVICCLIGLGFIFAFIDGIVSISPRVFFSDARNFIALPIFAVLVFLSFAPMLMLVKSKQIEKPRLYFIFVGVTELIVIALFIGMLFPKL